MLAGPGAGKTFCLTERIGYLIEAHGFAPERICAFTFTNKAAGEIAHRLENRLGDAADKITRGTIHAFCADLLRELGGHVGLEQGFGIADEEYQLSALRRIEGPRRWHRNTLTRFSAHRFRNDPLFSDDIALFDKYERFLAERKLVDFDTLVIKAAELFEQKDDAAQVRARFDVVLVDEFQDLNPVQYRVIRSLAKEHRHIFAVGDDEQSIYSWAGADPTVFRSYANDFGITDAIELEDNRRCPQEVSALARQLIKLNPPIFERRVAPHANRATAFPVRAVGFDTDEAEAEWIVEDIRADKDEHEHAWGDVALLYRKHEIGDRLEAALLNAGIPCRLAQGRALADDPVVAYVIAAARVIANPRDELFANAFLRVVLPRPLYDETLAKSEEGRISLVMQLRRMAAQLPRADENARQIRRALADWRNLEAVGKQHATLTQLVQELLSRRVGKVRSILDEHQDEITDPQSHPDVVALAKRLDAARENRARVWIAPMNGIDIPIKGMLAELGVDAVRGTPPTGAECIGPDDVPSVGIALGVFKAAQLVEMRDSSAAFTNFTAIDLETTDNDIGKAEVIEIAAVRVRNGKIAETFVSLVKPSVPITPGASEVHGIHDKDVAHAPSFAAIWPTVREFCGEDVVVAHNGYDFDFRILQRLAKAAEQPFGLCTFDSLPLSRELFATSRKLVDLARQFGIDPGTSHRALDDTKTLANVLLKLGDEKLRRGRKTALVDLLGHLGVALSLTKNKELNDEAQLFLKKLTPVYALGKYSGALDWYEQQAAGDTSIPGVEAVVEALGGMEKLLRIRSSKTADERYPAAMLRLRRLIAEIPEGTLVQQLLVFLERVVLSRWDGTEPERSRVNLLTLHSTKGLEFSRVYVVGAEDAQLPGGSPTKATKPQELEEARRLLYVGMTRTIDRLVLTQVATRGEQPTGGHRFLDEMGLKPESPE